MVRRRFGLLFSLGALVVVGAVAGAFSLAAAESYATAGRLRVSHGPVLLTPPGQSQPYVIPEDYPLAVGDEVETDEKGLAEIEVPGATLLRLGPLARLAFDALGDGREPTRVALLAGSLYVRLPLRRGEPVEVATASGTVQIRSGVARIDQPAADYVRVRAFAGDIHVVQGNEGRFAYTLRPGDEVFLGRGDGPHPARDERDDRLDAFHRERETALARAPRPEDLPLERPIVGAYDLPRYGEFIVVENVSYYRPYVPAYWKPYWNGYWYWHPIFGWTWHSYDPFGFVTFHHGWWIHHPRFGWLWKPGFQWVPAHVVWVTYGPYVGWAPLDPWGYPVVVGAPVAVVDVHIVIALGSWSFAPHNAFTAWRPVTAPVVRVSAPSAQVAPAPIRPVTVDLRLVSRDTRPTTVRSAPDPVNAVKVRPDDVAAAKRPRWQRSAQAPAPVVSAPMVPSSDPRARRDRDQDMKGLRDGEAAQASRLAKEPERGSAAAGPEPAPAPSESLSVGRRSHERGRDRTEGLAQGEPSLTPVPPRAAPAAPVREGSTDRDKIIAERRERIRAERSRASEASTITPRRHDAAESARMEPGRPQTTRGVRDDQEQYRGVDRERPPAGKPFGGREGASFRRDDDGGRRGAASPAPGPPAVGPTQASPGAAAAAGTGPGWRSTRPPDPGAAAMPDKAGRAGKPAEGAPESPGRALGSTGADAPGGWRTPGSMR